MVMGAGRRPDFARTYLLGMLAVTTAVLIVPSALVWALSREGLISSPWLCIALAVALALIIVSVGNAWWQRREGSREVLFSELLVWGWLRRVRTDHQIARTLAALDDSSAPTPSGNGQRLRQLRGLAAALEAQDPYLAGHSRRVARHAVGIARRMHLPAEQVRTIRTAALLHDVGKLRLPRELLHKPTRLSNEEFERAKHHAEAGAVMASGLAERELSAIIRHHHERFDGSGYPSGLAGEAIPLGARIVAVSDTFDAITSARPYRPAAAHRVALDRLRAASGHQLDPAVVRAFIAYYSDRRAAAIAGALAVLSQGSARRAVRQPAAGAAGAAALAAVALAAAGPPHTTPVRRRPPPTQAQIPPVSPAPPARPRPRTPARPAAVAYAPPAPRPPARPTSRTPPVPIAPRALAAPPPARTKPRRGHPPRQHPTHPKLPSPPKPPPAPPAPTPPPAPSPPTPVPPPVPTSREQCKDGGFANFGFRNQGQCVSFVETGR